MTTAAEPPPQPPAPRMVRPLEFLPWFRTRAKAFWLSLGTVLTSIMAILSQYDAIASRLPFSQKWIFPALMVLQLIVIGIIVAFICTKHAPATSKTYLTSTKELDLFYQYWIALWAVWFLMFAVWTVRIARWAQGEESLDTQAQAVYLAYISPVLGVCTTEGSIQDGLRMLPVPEILGPRHDGQDITEADKVALTNEVKRIRSLVNALGTGISHGLPPAVQGDCGSLEKAMANFSAESEHARDRFRIWQVVLNALNNLQSVMLYMLFLSMAPKRLYRKLTPNPLLIGFLIVTILAIAEFILAVEFDGRLCT